METSEKIKKIIEKRGRGWAETNLSLEEVKKAAGNKKGKADDAILIIRETQRNCGTKIDSHGARLAMDSTSAKKWYGATKDGEVFECEKRQPHEMQERQFNIDF